MSEFVRRFVALFTASVVLGVIAFSLVGPQVLSAAENASSASCVRQVSRGVSVNEISVAEGPFNMHHRLSSASDGGVETLVTVTRNGKLFYQIEASAKKGGAGTVTITYGPGVASIKKVTATTTDGKTFQGSMDGRAFTATGKPLSIQEIRFRDGRPTAAPGRPGPGAAIGLPAQEDGSGAGLLRARLRFRRQTRPHDSQRRQNRPAAASRRESGRLHLFARRVLLQPGLHQLL